MCGILALVGTPWQQCAKHALARLQSRGPDAQNIWCHEDATLGHARLSVIDHAGGAQPMMSATGKHIIVYNGEVYNFRALREELQRHGHRFSTHSDTEVVLHSFLKWGKSCVTRFDGMFAFAIWDRDARTLFAARDRLGIKPLFYADRKGLALASTLAPFFALNGFSHELDFEAVRDYLAFQTPLAPHSFLRDVHQLPPAHTLEWSADHGGARVKAFWQIPTSRPLAEAPADTLGELDVLIGKAVERQLVSDVPLGAFLSGGIDSSLIVHYMAQAHAKPLLTFSVRFAEDRYDESSSASAVARHYGTEHHVIEAPYIGSGEFLEAVGTLDQPLADPAYVPTWALAQRTRRYVKVALSGDGGDELFGGYARFLDTESRNPDSAMKRILRRAIAMGIAPGALLRRSLAGQDMLLYRRIELGPWSSSRKSLDRYLTPEALMACRPEKTLHSWRELALKFGGQMDTGALMRADLWTYLSENCLVKTDRASMAHGLEARVPLLANSLVDFALMLPAQAHVTPTPKALLRTLAQRKLPEIVWNRPKHGFSVPLSAYFNGSWREICEHAISRTYELAPFLNGEEVTKLWRRARAGRASRRLAYTFVVLLLWLEQHSVA